MRPTLRFAALALTLITAPLAVTAAEAPASPAVALKALPGGKYVLDKSHASLLFSINHLGFSEYKGRFNDFDATLFYDPSKPENSNVKVSVTIASVDTNNAELETKLKSETFFDAAKFGVATFTSTKFEKLTDTTGKLTGTLSLHGITRPLTLDVTLKGAGNNPYSKKPTIGFSGVTTLKRSDFGVKEYLPSVGDAVAIAIDAEFNQAD